MIVISPRGPSGPASEGDARLFRYVREGTVAVIVIEPVLPVIRDVNVGPAVIVIVADRDAESLTFVGHTRLFGYIRKRAVVVVVEQHGAGSWFFSFQCCDGGTVQQVDIQPAVIVIVD